MDRLNGNVQSRGNRGSDQSSMHTKKGGEKGRDNNVKESNLRNKASRKSGGESLHLSNFWYSYATTKAQLTVFRFVFFLLLSLDSFEQLPRTYKITGSAQNHTHFNLPHFSFPFSLLPSPAPSLLIGSWLASFFLGARVAFGLGGKLDVLLLAFLKGYTVFVSQVDNYQHHYLTVLVLIILANIPWRSLGYSWSSFPLYTFGRLSRNSIRDG
jgi:hypothetical protein